MDAFLLFRLLPLLSNIIPSFCLLLHFSKTFSFFPLKNFIFFLFF
jgi:hypothetical protein